MCGIAGILDFKETVSEGTLRRMTRALAHRGPNAEGVFLEKNVGLGHRRLSIIDLSDAANQPITDASGRFTIVFNGEMYNYSSVRTEFKAYPYKTDSDTEVLLAAFAKEGVSCIERFSGMFAFAVWDNVEEELIVFRDRMGVKPLYYYADESRFVFASETRAILSTGLVKPKLNLSGVYEFLSYQSTGFPETMIDGIHQLEAGHYLKIRQGKVESTAYWRFAVPQSEYESKDAVQQQIKNLLVQSVQRRLVSDVPVGAFLSGGIDSSIVVGLMAENCGIKPNTFNVSFAEKEFDESEYAKIIAKKFNTNHTEIRLSPSVMLEELEAGLSAMDTPSGDGMNSYVVSKAIKNAGITVALSGIGGDELFAGYPLFGQFQRLHLKNVLWKNMAWPRKVVANCLHANVFNNKKLRLKDLLSMQAADIEYVYPVLRSLLPKRTLNALTNISKDATALEDYLVKNSAHFKQFPVLSQMSIAEYMGYTQHTLLKDTDQMSMAVALEVREPFFDTDLVSYVLGVPDKYKQPLYPKSLLVESVKPLLPEEVVHRKKQGFVFPWDIWMRNELKSFCETHIDNLRKRSFINGRQLHEFWLQFLKGNPSIRWMDVWVFVVLEFWLSKNAINE